MFLKAQKWQRVQQGAYVCQEYRNKFLKLIFLHYLHFCFIRIAPHSSEYVQNLLFFLVSRSTKRRTRKLVFNKFLDTLALSSLV